MNQTTNYRLNQWEPADQVQRTDFNADNAKLDAAIAGVAGKAATAPDVLLRYALTAASHTAVFSFSGAGKYDVLRLLFWGQAASSANPCWLQLNGVTDSARYLYISQAGTSSVKGAAIMLGRAELAADGGGFLDIWLHPAGSHTLVQNAGVGVNGTVLTASQTYGAALNTSFSGLYRISISLGLNNEQLAAGTKGILLGYQF